MTSKSLSLNVKAFLYKLTSSLLNSLHSSVEIPANQYELPWPQTEKAKQNTKANLGGGGEESPPGSRIPAPQGSSHPQHKLSKWFVHAVLRAQLCLKESGCIEERLIPLCLISPSVSDMLPSGQGLPRAGTGGTTPKPEVPVSRWPAWSPQGSEVP